MDRPERRRSTRLRRSPCTSDPSPTWGLFSSIRADIEPHLAKEEQVLFPAIQQLADASEELMFEFGSIDGCASYAALFAGLEQVEADTHLHIHKENNVLFPQVMELEQQRSS